MKVKDHKNPWSGEIKLFSGGKCEKHDMEIKAEGKFAFAEY